MNSLSKSEQNKDWIKPGQVWKTKYRIVCTIEKVCNPIYDIFGDEGYWIVLVIDSQNKWEKLGSIKEILISPYVHEKF